MKWLPMPKIAHGIAICPFTPSLVHQPQSSSPPSRTPAAYSTVNSPRLSPQPDTASVTASSSDHHSNQSADYAALIPLEVGDEIFIFEQQGAWYRGYVLGMVEEGKRPSVAPIGCFPRSHVKIKEYLEIERCEGDVAVTRRKDSMLDDRPMSPTAPWMTPDSTNLSRSLSESHIQTPNRKSIHDLQDTSLLSSRPHSMEIDTSERHLPPPPLPLDRFDQSTFTGTSEPLVDEIGACVSDWNSLLYVYLEEKKYMAFNAVRDHINYLIQARRQLLDQALSREELFRLRKEIVHDMAMMNLSQNREMIIRHPDRGYLLDTNTTSLATLYRMHWKYASAHQLPLSSFPSTPGHPSSRVQHMTPTQVSTPYGNDTSTQQHLQHQHPSKGAKFHHLFFELKACVAQICLPGEYTELYFSLYSKTEAKFMTEQFAVVLTYNGMPKDESQIGKLQTLFTDLSSHDLDPGLYLICRVVRLGGMKFVDKERDHLGAFGNHASMIFGGDSNRMMGYFDHNAGSLATKQQHNSTSSQTSSYTPGSLSPTNTTPLNQCRRPFGCAVLHLASFFEEVEHSSAPNVAGTYGGVATPTYFSPGSSGPTGLNSHGTSQENDMRIYTATSESNFATLHEDIINNNVKEFTKNPKAEMLCVYLRLFYGQLDEVTKTYAALLRDVPRTARLGFPDVVFPDDERNELYITLSSGDFAQFGRSRNIQVTLCVRDNRTGEVVENSLSQGAGAPYTSYWESMIFYHEQRPKWGEMVKVKIKDSRLWERSHVFITVKHKSSHGATTGNNNSLKLSDGMTSPSGSTNDRVLAMGFLPLFLPPLHRDFIADGSHTLYLYKYDRQLLHPHTYIENVPWCYRSSTPSNMINQDSSRSQRARIGQHYGGTGSISKGTNGVFSATSLFNTSTNHLASYGASGSSSNLADSASSIVSTDHAAGPTTPSKLNTSRDTITLTTFLCSTRFTQNKTLVKLLNWRSILELDSDGGDELLAVLDKFSFVGEMEVVKFLSDIFDALLDILVCQHRNMARREELNDQVLAAMLWVLGIVQDRRFSNFRPVVDVYIEKRFALTEERMDNVREKMTYDELLQGMKRLCDNPSDAKKAKRLRSSMKVWDYVFRFIVRSREMQQHTEEEGERGLRDFVFKEELQELLALITQMMGPDQPSVMIGNQTLAMQHFADILCELRHVFTYKELVDTTTKFVDACAHVTGKLVGYRLCMILAVVKGPVFNDMTCRSGLAKSVFRWIGVWLNSYMAAAKDIIFARNNGSHVSDQAQHRIPRVQWLENLRLSLTIVSEVLEKARRSCGMASSGLTSASFSSPSLHTLSRPASMATNGDMESTDDSQTDLTSITEVALQLVPQLLNAYKDLQRLAHQALQASVMSDHASTSTGDRSLPSRPNSSLHSLKMRRDRSSSMNLRATSPSPVHSEGDGPVKLQALATSPIAPFPATYPLPTSGSKDTSLPGDSKLSVMVTTGLLDLTVVLLELFYLTPQQQWVGYLNKMYEDEGEQAVSDFLCKICHTCMAILFGDDLQMLEDKAGSDESFDPYEPDSLQALLKLPDTWLNLGVIAHQIVLCHILSPAARMLEKEAFYPQSESSEETVDVSVIVLWKTFLVSVLRTIASPRLDIENCLPQSQRAIWKLAGNMKGTVGAKTMTDLWNLAGPRYRVGGQRAPAFLSYFDGKAPTMASDTPPLYPATSDRNSTCSIEEDWRSAIGDTMFGDDTDKQAAKTVLMSKSPREAFVNETDEAIILSKDSMEPITMTTPEISMIHIQLLPVVLRPLCSVSLTLDDKVRFPAVSIIADIIAIDLALYENALRVQHQLIRTIDQLVMSDNRGSETTRIKLTTELNHALEQKLAAQGTLQYAKLGEKAVEFVSKYLELLLQIRDLPNDNEFMDERINATLKLMKFIQVIEREDIYTKYVHQLVQLHVDSYNYVEAALTLRFHADLLRWDPHEQLAAIPELDFDAQSSFARKESLYETMIVYLEKGNAWELCVKLCKELAQEYEHTVFDYGKLSKILHREAKLVQDIVEKKRCFTGYFRVGFYGRGFPPGLRNHQFIYRGLEWEKISSFVERMQNRHPNAQLLSGKSATIPVISGEQLRGLESSLDGQFLQVTPVEPVVDTKLHPQLNNPLLPESIREYYAANEVSRFTFSRLVAKEFEQSKEEASRPETDFLNLWTETAMLTCEDAFPTIARRSQITEVTVIEVSPIENAVKAMKDKNEQLEQLEKKYAVYENRSPTTPVNINPFSMALNGAVDAPVNGGVPLYKKAFLTQTYWHKNPEMRPWVEKLRDIIDAQVKVIRHCLDTHSRLVENDMRPFHNTLVEFFKKNFCEEIQRLEKVKDTPSTDKPAMPTSRPISIYSQNPAEQRAAAGRQHSATPMPPISRAFSIHNEPQRQRAVSAIETASNRAGSISRTFNQFRKTGRKKSQG